MAVIDVGTNTVLFLLMARRGDAPPAVVARDGKTTRLGEGMARGAPSPAAVERTLKAVEGYLRRAERGGADDIIIVGTAALRRPGAPVGFAAAVKARFGLDVEVLTPAEEGALSWLAARRSLPAASDALVVADVGGGSAQVARAAGPGATVVATSYAIGCVWVTEQFTLEPFRAAAWEAARSYIRGALADLAPAQAGDTVVATGGTATTLAAVAQRLVVFDYRRVHGYEMTTAAVARWAETLAAKTPRARRAVPGLPADRADIIAAGALALAEILRKLGAEAVTVSAEGLRYGVACRYFDRDRRT